MSRPFNIVQNDIKELPNNIEAEQSVMGSILVSNDDASNACEITVTLLNTSDTVFSLFKQKDISAKTTTELLSNPLVMNTDEELKVQAENANDLHVVVSYLEIT